MRPTALVQTPPCQEGRWRRPNAVRKPKDYQTQAPGDLAPFDTLDVWPRPEYVLQHLTARDVVSRWDVLESPKLNGHVERVQRTHTAECCACGAALLTVTA